MRDSGRTTHSFAALSASAFPLERRIGPTRALSLPGSVAAWLAVTLT